MWGVPETADEPFEPIVESLLKYPLDSPEFEDAARVAGPAEIAETLRQLDQQQEAFLERQERINERKAELLSEHPELADDDA